MCKKIKYVTELMRLHSSSCPVCNIGMKGDCNGFICYFKVSIIVMKNKKNQYTFTADTTDTADYCIVCKNPHQIWECDILRSDAIKYLNGRKHF